jgi:hypothetical protein
VTAGIEPLKLGKFNEYTQDHVKIAVYCAADDTILAMEE